MSRRKLFAMTDFFVPFFVAAGVALGATSITTDQAHAGSVLMCTLTSVSKGTDTTFRFIKGTDNSIHETAVWRGDGMVTDHRYPSLPGWGANWDSIKFWMVPDANRDYQLVAFKLGPMNPNGWRMAGAAMFKTVNGQDVLVSRGQCGTKGRAWERDEQSPVFPVVAAAPSIEVQSQPTMTPPASSGDEGILGY